MLKIGVPLSERSYTPESYAYYDFLIAKGCDVQLDYTLDPNNDINIQFMGLEPFWKKEKHRCITVHEYHSLSTPPFASLKDFVKYNINKTPQGRVFLSDFVKSEMSFKDELPYIIRDMGIDKGFFQIPKNVPDFDITYCGSIMGRKGLVEEIIRLSLLGFKIQLIGSVDLPTYRIFKKHINIKVWGRVSREHIPELYKNSRCGLNFIPNVSPFNKQTSTKVLEYSASNLLVLSNQYEWISSFSKKNAIDIVWLEDVKKFNDLEKKDIFYNEKYDFERFEWNNILVKSDFYGFLLNLVNNNT